MCSILYKCEIPGKDLLKNTVKIRKEKKKSSLAWTLSAEAVFTFQLC